MYKVMCRVNGELLSVLSLLHPDHDLQDLVHQYTEGVWNETKNGYPFLGFDSLEDAKRFVKWESFDAEIWYCHAREIKEVRRVIELYSKDPLEKAYEFWSRKYIHQYHLRLAPLGTLSCKKIKPVRKVCKCAVGDDPLYINFIMYDKEGNEVEGLD